MLSYLVACTALWPSFIHHNLRCTFSGDPSLWLLVDPIELSILVLDELLWLEPQSNLLLCALNSVRAVADVTANIDGIVTANGTWSRCERVGSTKDHYYMLVRSVKLP